MSGEEIRELKRRLREEKKEAEEIMDLSPVFHERVPLCEREAFLYDYCLKRLNFSDDERKEVLPQITVVPETFFNYPKFQP